LISSIEEKFNISINDEDLSIENFKDVNSIVALIRKYQ
jgi:acyl carrier protein